ncbi:RNA polymerase sigma factor [Sediminibacterium ginsengisoli]|uniref:RNA polymerase sigma-70 factor, ECF subfamily n=1 Tax=Sediminibacterium ginsengisoli TaxID=413434 RepID=A0A1T4JQT7_9BACT|nr:RNA polymerase sigma factor [Sediminibacterium ginsengisoli]SJZ32491.1 RNA polymerase sigma-70 factor, ECF subfamily [Sediminibacterium ginsengisoli]
MEQEYTIQTAVVRKACKGDGESQSWLYRQYSKAMFNICMRMTGNRNDAEDVLQDAFILAFRNIHQLKEPAQFGGWLKRIVVNECIRFSKKNLQWSDWDEKWDDSLRNEEPEWWTTVSLELVHREIKGLPDGCRQVFNLYVLEDYSHRDIASNLGISESTSKSQYHRARQLLKERITKQLQIHG